MVAEEEGDEEYFVPLVDQRVFGAGIKRKRVQFQPASEPIATPILQEHSSPKAVGDHYLSIVQRKSKSPHTPQPQQNKPQEQVSELLCEICKLPLPTTTTSSTTTKPHESSLAHQVCLSHSHPPSHLDRTRTGLKYLSSYGWDPDSRLGLGASGEGIRIPIKGKLKNDTVGLGVNVAKLARKSSVKVGVGKKEKLNAKEVRRTENQGRKQMEQLREMFYRSEDLERYLGTAG